MKIEYAIQLVQSGHHLGDDELDIVRAIVESAPSPSNDAPRFHADTIQWENQPVSLKIGMAVGVVFYLQAAGYTPAQRESFRSNAAGFVQSLTEDQITIRTFLGIFDYWATGQEDWKEAFAHAAMVSEACEIFEEYLSDELEE